MEELKTVLEIGQAVGGSGATVALIYILIDRAYKSRRNGKHENSEFPKENLERISELHTKVNEHIKENYEHCALQISTCNKIFTEMKERLVRIETLLINGRKGG